MTTEPDDQVKNVLTKQSVTLNEGCFLVRINKNDVNQTDLLKQFLYGDAFPSAYSKNITMIPVSVFLPQMFQGKNIFMEYKSRNTKISLMDRFLPFAFLIHESGHKEIKQMYDKVFKSKEDQSYGEIYEKMIKSVSNHTKNLKRRVNFPYESDLLNGDDKDEQTENFLKENGDSYSVIFVTATSATRLLQADPEDLRFGNGNDSYYVQLATSALAKFDGISTSQLCNVKFSNRICKAIKRELITMIQLFVGYEKKPGESLQEYIQNIYYLFNDQIKSISCKNYENIESYSLSVLKLFLSRNLEIDDINTTSAILSDTEYEETIRKKVLFQLLMIMDMGSCFNARNLCKQAVTKDKPTIVSTSSYTNPFNELKGAVYENISWLTHISTMCVFYAQVKNRKCCETCEQKICVVNVPSLMFTFSTNVASNNMKEKTGAVLSFNTVNNFNKTGPLGNLRSKDTKTPYTKTPYSSADESNNDDRKAVIWEKNHRDLLNQLIDSYNIDFSLFAESTPTTESNIEERAERFLNRVSDQLDNILSYCEQFLGELDDGAESVAQVNKVEAELRNVYRVSNLYDKGFVNILLSESLQYILRCIILFEQTDFQNQTVNDVFLKIRPLLLDNKSGLFDVTHVDSLKDITIPKIAVKSYTSDDMQIDVQSEISENYCLDEFVYNVSFKCKSYLYGRHEGNCSKYKVSMVQNMANRKTGGSASSMVLNNSFLYFKNFCSRQACDVLGIHDDDYCRDVLNEMRDEILDKYAYLFKYVNQFKMEDWSSLMLLISMYKTLEYLNFQPAYNRIGFMTFNKLVESTQSKNYKFQQCILDDDFNKFETLYGINCNIIEFITEKQGKKICFKKCASKNLNPHNELLNAFSVNRNHPGAPVYYIPFGEKSNRFKVSTNMNLLNKFINEDQYKLEKDAAYTGYIKKHKKQFYDSIFEEIFADYENYIENRYTSEILEEMLSEFDERYPPSLFINGKIHEFLKFVLEQYFNPDQTKVQLMAKRIKEIYMRVKSRSRKRQYDENETTDEKEMYVHQTCQGDDEDDAESQFLPKKQKLE